VTFKKGERRASFQRGLDWRMVEIKWRRFRAFPPQLASSYVTREEAELLHRMGAEMNAAQFIQLTGTPFSLFLVLIAVVVVSWLAY
jgi:hypothetical protein